MLCQRSAAPVLTPTSPRAPVPSLTPHPYPPHTHPTHTQMYCEKGKTDCYIYRLYKPCLKGRCKLEPDPTLASSVFSDVADVVSKAG